MDKPTPSLVERQLIEWRSLAQEMTPGGSEFMSPEAVRAYYRDFKDRYHEAKCNEARLRKELAALTAAPAPEDAERLSRLTQLEKEFEAAGADYLALLEYCGVESIMQLRDEYLRFKASASWCFDMEKAPRDGTEIDIWMSIGVRQADCRWGNPSRANWGDRYGRDQNLPEQWITRECVALDRRNGVPIAWMLPPAPPTPARGQP